MGHKHIFTFLGYLGIDECSSGYKLYWCNQCGTTALKISNGKYYTMVPEYLSDNISVKVKIVEEKPNWLKPAKVKRQQKRKKRERKALGRGFTDIHENNRKITLNNLIKALSKND